MKHKFHRKSKYNAKPTEVDGFRFDSKKEAQYYRDLKSMVVAGEVITFLRQVPFRLPGRVRYVCDFLVFYANGECEFVDVKGYDTPMSKLKRKQVEAVYHPIKIILA